MMGADRRADCGEGLLLYLKTAEMTKIPATHTNKRGKGVECSQWGDMVCSQGVDMECSQGGDMEYSQGVYIECSQG